MSRIGAVVMAAGAGRRMGGRPKSLLRRDGVPLVERTARLLLACGVAPVVVVLGHHADAIEPVLRRVQAGLPDAGALLWTVNPRPDEGPGGSLRAGLAALPGELDTVLVALADQPLLQDEDIGQLLRAWSAREVGQELLVPRFEDRPGHPVVLGATVRAAVQQSDGAGGLREWRLAHPQRVLWLAVSHPRHVVDVDSPADLQRLAQHHGVLLEWPPGLA